MIDYEQAKTGIDITKLATQQTKAPTTTAKPTTKQVVSNIADSLNSTDRGKWGTGSAVSKVFDVLSTPQYAVAGGAKALIKGQNIFKGAGEGVKNRASFADVAGEAGVKNKYLRAGLGLAGDLLLDPLNLVGVGLVSKAAKAKNLGLISKGAQNIIKGTEAVKSAVNPVKILSKYGDTGEKLLDVMGTFNKGIRYRNIDQGLYEGLKTAKNVADTEAIDVGKKLGSAILRAPEDIKVGNTIIKKGQLLPESFNKRITQLLEEGAVTENPILKKVTGDIKEKFSQYGSEMQKAGLLPKGNLKYEGTYLPGYRKMDVDNTGFGNAMKIVQGRTKGRMKLEDWGQAFADFKGIDLSNLSDFEKQRRLRVYGKQARDTYMVRDPAYRATKGLIEEGRSINFAKFSEGIDKNFAKSAEDVIKIPNFDKQYIQLPDSESLGKLKGKFVPKAIYDDIKTMPQFGIGTNSKLLKGYDKFMSGYWKPAKTVVNPSFHIRNAISNQIQNYLVGGAGVTRRLPEAIKELKNKGKYYNEAKQSGLFANSFIGNELDDILNLKDRGASKNIISTAWNNLKEAGGNIQEVSESVGKLQQFIHQRKLGKSVEEAKALAEKALFNYGDISSFEKNVLKRFAPFYTFTRKAVPLVGSTAVKNPTRLTAFRKIENAVNELTPERAGERKVLPEYLQDTVRIPGTKKGYYSTKFIYPWGNMIGESDLPFGLNIPGVDMYQKLVQGYDPYFKQPLTTSPLPKDMRKAKVGATARTLLPTLPGNLLGDLAPGVFKPDYAGRKKTPSQIILSNLLGQKVYDLNKDSAMVGQGYELKDIQSKVQAEMKRATAIQDPVKREKKMKELLDFLQSEQQRILNNK